MTHGGDVGYELQSSLLVDAASGLPVAPLVQTLTDSKGCRSTLTEGLSDSLTHMDALTADISRVEALGIGKKLVHLIGVSLDIENYCTLRLFFDLPTLAGLSRRNLPEAGIRLLFQI